MRCPTVLAPRHPNVTALAFHLQDILLNAQRLVDARFTCDVNDAITNIEYHILKIREKQKL
jgi:hypothetical protein